MSRTFLIVVIMVLAFISCKQENKNVQVSDSVNSELLLKEIDSLRLQLSLYKDTIFEQRERLERIKKIIEPFIQQEDYE